MIETENLKYSAETYILNNAVFIAENRSISLHLFKDLIYVVYMLNALSDAALFLTEVQIKQISQSISDIIDYQGAYLKDSLTPTII